MRKDQCIQVCNIKKGGRNKETIGANRIEIKKPTPTINARQTPKNQQHKVVFETTEQTDKSEDVGITTATLPVYNTNPPKKINLTEGLRNAEPVSCPAREHAEHIEVDARKPKVTSSKTESPTNDVTRHQILLFGGIDPFNPTSNDQQGKNVLQYNIRANNWTIATNMPGSRHHHSAIHHLGKIFIVGGTRPAYENIMPTLSSSVWSFDPDTLQWRNECDLPEPRRDFGLVSTRKGIFVIGGEDIHKKFLSSVLFLSNEENAEWISVESLHMARTGPAVALYKDQILAAGGITPSPNCHVTSSVEAYNLDTDHWTEICKLRKPRSFGRLCVLSNSSVYIVGGVTVEGNRFISLTSVDRYDPKAKQWRKEANMTFARHGHDVLALDDKILIVGGVTSNKNMTLSSVECYSTTIGRWICGVRSLPSAISGMAAAVHSK